VISPTGPACRAAPAGAADVVDGSGASVIMSGDPEVRALAARVEEISTKLDVASKSHESSLAVLTSLAQKVDHISEMLQGGVGAKGMPNGAMTLHRRGSAASAGNAVEQTVKEQRDAKRRENMLNKMAKEEVFGVTVGEKAAESKKLAKLQLAFLRKGIVLPTGRFRQTWDSTFLCAIIYIVLLFPYRIAFVTEQSMAYAVIDFILDLFFLADIPLNFCTAFYEPDTNILVTNHRRIAKHYSKTWLLPDVVASIPYDWFISGVRLSSSSVFDGDGDSGVAAQLPQVLRTIRCIKLIRLLRVAGVGRRLEKIVERFSLEVILNNDVLHLLGIAGFMTLFAHWNACFQYLLATLEADITFVNGNLTQAYSFHPDSWVSGMIADGAIQPDLSNIYVWCFYGAWMQMLAIAQGLKEPKREVEMWGTLISILCGAVIYAVFLASLTTVLAESDHSAKEYRKKLNMMNEYMKYAQVPKKLRNHLHSYYELFFPSKRSFDEGDIMAELSRPLRAQVALYKCRAVLDALQLISSESSEMEMNGLMETISLNLERVLYINGDFIIRAGDEADGMYFISKGYAEVLNKNGVVLTTLATGSFFGEMALLEPERRTTASIQVSSFCDTFFLSKMGFDRLVHMYPSFRTYLATVAKLRSGQNTTRDKAKTKLNKVSGAISAVKALNRAKMGGLAPCTPQPPSQAVQI